MMNCKEQTPEMARLLKWDEVGVIKLKFSRHSQAPVARSTKDQHKSWNRWTVCPVISTEKQRDLRSEIREIVFGTRRVTQSRHNDVMIVFSAVENGMILLTYDGAILRAAAGLKRVGAQVMHPSGTIKLIADAILDRDRRETAMAERDNRRIAHWVGKD